MKRYVTTQDALHELALKYLERFDVPEAGMRRYLRRKINEAIAAEQLTWREGGPWIDDEVARLTRVGLLNDERWAQRRIEQQRRKGKSGRGLQADLRAKGIDKDLAARLLAEEREDPAADLEAAANYARKRRFGPWSRPENRADHRQKQLSSLARRGFSFDVVRTIVDAASPDEVQELIDTRRETASE